MYYVIEESYVGPRNEPWEKPTTMGIFAEPGRTNLGNQEKTDGWLGTTNDWSRNAEGEFETLAEAREYITNKGFILINNPDLCDNDAIENYWHASDSRDQWKAEDWFQMAVPEEIAGDTTDEQIVDIARRLEREAREQNAEIWDCEEYLISLRDGLKAEAV